jgi:hypothetical protein
VAPITREGPSQFRVSFPELAKKGRRAFSAVDPYSVAIALSEVASACTMRSAAGHGLLWNDYRVVLARSDFDFLGALASTLDRDLVQVLGEDFERRDVELVGDLRISIVADEADELRSGEAVIRAAFVPTERFDAPPRGALTIRADRPVRRASARKDTIEREVAYVVSWPHGRATLEPGATLVVGRPHPSPPGRFIALEGASAKINKQHLVLSAGARGLRIARPEKANPVHVNGEALAPGEHVEASPPITISLSKGDLVLVVSEP